MPRLGSRVRASFSAHILNNFFAEIAQLVEHNLAKVRVASSSLVFRSKGRNLTINACPGGGMVDALVSGASVERRASSSLVLGTTKVRFQSNLEEWRNW